MEQTDTPPEPTCIPAVNGTDVRVALPKYWVAALVQVRNEKAVGERLSKLDIENYVATQWELHQWSDRKKKVERVVVPMVVFVRADKKTIRRLVTYTFIRKLVSYPGKWEPAFIPESQVERLKYMLHHAESPVELRERVFKTGETVRIARGPLKDLEGELCHIEDDREMVAVRIDCLGYACVHISKTDLQPSESPDARQQ